MKRKKFKFKSLTDRRCHGSSIPIHLLRSKSFTFAFVSISEIIFLVFSIISFFLFSSPPYTLRFSYRRTPKWNRLMKCRALCVFFFCSLSNRNTCLRCQINVYFINLRASMLSKKFIFFFRFLLSRRRFIFLCAQSQALSNIWTNIYNRPRQKAFQIDAKWDVDRRNMKSENCALPFH